MWSPSCMALQFGLCQNLCSPERGVSPLWERWVGSPRGWQQFVGMERDEKGPRMTGATCRRRKQLAAGRLNSRAQPTPPEACRVWSELVSWAVVRGSLFPREGVRFLIADFHKWSSPGRHPFLLLVHPPADPQLRQMKCLHRPVRGARKEYRRGKKIRGKFFRGFYDFLAMFFFTPLFFAPRGKILRLHPYFELSEAVFFQK